MEFDVNLDLLSELILQIAVLLLIAVLAVVFLCTIFSGYLGSTGDFSQMITVDNKQMYGAEYMLIFNGSVSYYAPGYIWNDVVVGQIYNISGNCRDNRIATIERVVM